MTDTNSERKVKTPANRIVTREGVNATQVFFESTGCFFQEVAQQNDFGKDAYIDIVEKDGTTTPLCAALQIKSGESYRSANGDYFVPVENHASNWRQSTIPVFGVVYDPNDRLLRWADLTGYLRSNPEQDGGSIPVQSDAVLDMSSLRGEFRASVSIYAAVSSGSLSLNLLSKDESLQTDAVFDVWALGRHDHRYLIILRRLILELKPAAVRIAIFLLSHATPHPDIFWTKKNWIPEEIKKQVRPTFRWAPEEIAYMISVLDVEEWGRGTLGQSLDMLLYEDPGGVKMLHATVGHLINSHALTPAIRAATLALSHSHDARHELSLLIQDYPALTNEEWFQGIAAVVNETGEFSFYL